MKSGLREKVLKIKKELGSELCILGHYYQQDEVIEFVDHEGDSFTLADAGAKTIAKWIVFCGVHFMAEASVILAREGQRVFLPDMAAGCPLADMASFEEVTRAWRILEEQKIAGNFLPVVYMNSNAELKAFCGRMGGTVCTSSSAKRALEWAAGQGKKVFFFPDENLGRNIAYSLGTKENEICLWDPFAQTTDLEALRSAKVIVWKGFCHVHTFFTTEHIKKARENFPDCKIIVHPECDPSVVKLADGHGSTAYLNKFAGEAPSGSTVAIGTEINLVSRLAKKHPEKKIIPLARSLCPNMFKISLADLCATLENLGGVNEVLVTEDIAGDARTALNRMLLLK